ncbi:hypothetical protein EDD86DRAFT_278896 [Gorgonomyces haynaldii]|nr:hypothetical protein EDD86DRAFT_278896 [Gorgonomyces haynaldii]
MLFSAALFVVQSVQAKTLVNRGLALKTEGESFAAASGNLKYYGGPVIPNVEVHPIFYGSNVNYASQITGFYQGVVDSVHMDWLSEYNTPTQSIGRGTVGNSISVTTGIKSSLDDVNDIQPLLLKLAQSGQITPNANTYYPIHFAPGISITQGGSKSCQVFCAYHGTIKYGSGYIFYGVVPDQGGACAGGCGSSSNTFNNLCSVSSHELIEAVTDAAVGVASDIASPLAWYDQTNGEIGDICNAQQGTVVGGNGQTYTVQKEWSNKAGACIVSKASTPKPTSTVKATTTAKATSTPTTSACAHDKCVTGSVLKSSCDSCVAQIIAADSYCGSTQWDSVCVGEVKSVCGITC